MKYTLSQQIDAIQKARELVVRTSLDYMTQESDRAKWGEVANKLNDAGSTIAAMNLNPELKQYFNDDIYQGDSELPEASGEPDEQ